jgi:hypothetical protein
MPRTTKNLFCLVLTVLGWIAPSQASGQTKIRLATLLPRSSSLSSSGANGPAVAVSFQRQHQPHDLSGRHHG